MKFSQVDVIGQEKRLRLVHKENQSSGLFTRFLDYILHPRNPKHTFTFYVPTYLFLRSVSFCEDIEEEIGERFTTNHLARVLYIDFLEYVKKTNDLHTVYKRLQARGISPTTVKPFQTEDSYQGVLFEEARGFEEMKTTLDHRAALKGEFLLHDMLEIYMEHPFTLENILEVVYCDFMEDYRKGLVKNPIQKITQYID